MGIVKTSGNVKVIHKEVMNIWYVIGNIKLISYILRVFLNGTSNDGMPLHAHWTKSSPTLFES
jgi:hypothetical protein